MNYPSARIFCLGTMLSLLGLSGCVEPYMPAVLNTPTNYLVVDGFLNGNGVSRIKLSRTTSLSATAAPGVEKGARLFIVDNAGTRYAFTEKSSGSYQSDSLVLNPTRQYQLRITTTGSVTYESALVPLKVTPAIDNVSWRLDGSQVQFLLSTHDATAQSRYYRWSFAETWEFNSAYQSFLQYNTAQRAIETRTTPIYTCWRTEQPSAIKQGTSAQLSQDVITDAPVLSVSGRDERFKIRYSVLVSQYAETQEEFAYYELLRKNTEAVGGVNDPLPTQLTGNVHRVDDATEPVLGFVGAHTVQTKRLFIDRASLSLPASWVFNTPYLTCTLGEEILIDPNDPRQTIPYPQSRLYSNPGNVPVDLIRDPIDNSVLGYTGSSAACVDCRTRGSNVKPSYW